jgi:hypothetical protein
MSDQYSKKIISATKPFIPPVSEYQEKVSEILNRGWLTNQGPCVEELEERLKDYLKVENSYCQQGLGNIIYFLFNFSTVYLSEKSSSYHFFKNLGFEIRSTEELLNGRKLIRISDEEKKKNHELIQVHFNKQKVIHQWSEILSE